MNEEDLDQLLGDLIDHPTSRSGILDDAEVGESERDILRDLAGTADLLWLYARGAPPLSSDPVAEMLGLVADSRSLLDPKSLAQARKRAGITMGDLAGRLRARGWDFQQGDVFIWETRSTSDVVPAVVVALAEILGARVEHLTRDESSTSEQGQFADLRAEPRFAQLVDRWVAIYRVSRTAAVSALESRLMTAVHRGDSPDNEQLLRLLDALITALEQDDGTAI